MSLKHHVSVTFFNLWIKLLWENNKHVCVFFTAQDVIDLIDEDVPVHKKQKSNNEDNTKLDMKITTTKKNCQEEAI